jgi:uncharacterized phage protein (TIGR01671 family)
MREIKFRAWDKVQKKMGSVEGIDFLYSKAYPLIGNVKVGISFSDLELMQFTGLHDKTGKEIYEGDVVTNNDTNWQIFYDEGAYRMRVKDTTRRYLLTGEPQHSEVIGNICENPELISENPAA